MRFPFVRPQIPGPSDWVHYLEPSYKQRYFTNFGPVEQAFTKGLRERFAADGTSCVLCNNATSGLTAALIASGSRGRVLVPAFTFPATLQAVLAAQMEPVVCDVDADTWELSLEAAQQVFKEIPRVETIMPVRVFGYVRDHSVFDLLASRYGAAIITDAAAALGSGTVNCNSANGFRAEVFSLHATKSFGIGEGGAIFVSNAMESRLKRALNFGLNSDRSFALGLNGKMSEFQAAVGLSVLQRSNHMVERRAQMSAFYDRFFKAYPSVVVGSDRGCSPSSNFPVLMPKLMDVAGFCEKAAALGLQVRRYYFPSLTTSKLAGVLYPQPTPVSDDLAARMVCLPVYSDALDSDLNEISDILVSLMSEFL